LDIPTLTNITTAIAESVRTNTRFARAIHRITVSIDRTISRDITSIEPPGNTAAAKNTGSSNDRLVVIITAVQGRVSGAVIKGPSRVSRVVIAVQGRVSGVVIKVPGRVSGGIVAAPAAVSVGEPHSAAASADEVLASAMCFWS
jgi:hypothetical protein